MTKAEILRRTRFNEHGEGVLEVYCAMFGADASVSIFSCDDRSVSDRVVATINDFLALGPYHLPELKACLWEDCMESIECTSYGFPIEEGESETQASLRGFGIASADDAYRESHFHAFQVDAEDDGFEHRYGLVAFYPVWEQEHGCGIIMQDGKLIARYSNDVYFGWYEKGGKYAK